MKNYLISYLLNSFASGLLVSIGGVVFLTNDNKYIGSALFSLGLYTIIMFGFTLYTGKVGYIINKGVKYVPEVLLIMVGNFIGTAVTAIAIKQTRIGDGLSEKAFSIMDGKMEDSILSAFILAMFCGMLMYIAVENAVMCKAKNWETLIFVGTILPIMVFILCGFNHCIADMFYLFLSGNFRIEAIPYFITVIVGNAMGAFVIALIRKYTAIYQETKA